MRLFRSEEEIDADGGAVVPIAQLARLADRWYGDRLDPDWSPRSPAASQALLEECGLTSEFWRL